MQYSIRSLVQAEPQSSWTDGAHRVIRALSSELSRFAGYRHKGDAMFRYLPLELVVTAVLLTII